MVNKSIYSFVKDQWRTVPPALKTDLSGKTVMVIGATAGIGLEAAQHFAAMNPARLIIGCRNVDKGNTAITKIEQATGYKKIELSIIDLASFTSVSAFADEFETSSGRLDLLVANAGIGASEYIPTADGWESMLQVNHLSIVLLSLLLLPRMIQTARQFSTTPRLVVVSSDAHYRASVDKGMMDHSNSVETLGSKEYCTPAGMRGRYMISKLFNVFFARALNDHLSPSPPITVNSVNPGFCYSEIRRYMTGMRSWIHWLLMEKPLALTSEQGSRQLVYAAIGGKNEEEMQGVYVSNESIAEVSDYTLSEDGRKYQDKIWKETIHILAKADPRVERITTEYLSH